jgi:lambda family phage portal protein
MAFTTRLAKILKRSFGLNWPDAGNVFDSAGHGDRWPRSSQIWSPVSQSLAAAQPISTRAAWLAENSPTGASFVNCYTDNLVATGPTVRSQHPDEATRRVLEKRWNTFARNCDGEGIGDLVSFLAKVVRNWVISGESFVHLLIEDRRLKLRLINTEQCWRPLTRIMPNGNRIFSGVEISNSGKPLFYWCLKTQMDMPWAVYPLPDPISVDDMCHLFVPAFPGAVRGLSFFTPIAARLLELDRIEDSLMARLATAALFTGFIRSIEDQAGIAADSHPNRDGKPELSMEPGALRVLPPGTDITFPSNIPDIAGSGEFLNHVLRSIAHGGGVPASLLTGNLSDVNYSSARAGLEQFKRSVARLQQSHLVTQLLQRVWERWLTVEILSARLAAKDFEDNVDSYFDVDFRWFGWPSLDPVKDTTADVLALDNNLKSRASIIAASGRDIEDVDREIEADKLPRRAVSADTTRPQPIEADNA